VRGFGRHRLLEGDGGALGIGLAIGYQVIRLEALVRADGRRVRRGPCDATQLAVDEGREVTVLGDNLPSRGVRERFSVSGVGDCACGQMREERREKTREERRRRASYKEVNSKACAHTPSTTTTATTHMEYSKAEGVSCHEWR